MQDNTAAYSYALRVYLESEGASSGQEQLGLHFCHHHTVTKYQTLWFLGTTEAQPDITGCRDHPITVFYSHGLNYTLICDQCSCILTRSLRVPRRVYSLLLTLTSAFDGVDPNSVRISR